MSSQLSPRRSPVRPLPHLERSRRRPATGPGSLYFRVIRPCLLGAVVAIGCVPAACVAIAIALGNWITFRDASRVLFAQDRMGRDGRTFVMWKFRTMRDADEPHFDSWANGSDELRVTRFGSFLRRTHLDELPQLWNILRGDMSLVGPRPPVPEEVDHYETSERRRLSMRPGLTCIWQVSGRSEIGFERWVKLDCEYIDSWSLLLDAKILLKTIPAVLKGEGAF